MTLADERGLKQAKIGRNGRHVQLGETETLCITPRKGGNQACCPRGQVCEPLKIAAAVISMVGVGGSAGFYLAAAGFFEHQFKSHKFFLWMLIAIYIPYPATLVLQEKCDSHFDLMLTTRVTYFFRVILIQVVLGAIFVAYAFCINSAPGILICGLLLGFFGASSLSSTMQLMAAIAPHLTAWASLGKDIGGAFPVVTYMALHFYASRATSWEFQRMQAFPSVVLCFCAGCCALLHCTGIWDKAYLRLGYDLKDDSEDSDVTSETDPLLDDHDVDDAGVPLWVSKWQFAPAFNTGIQFMLMPLVCLMDNPDLTQKLTLGKLLMDCAARGIGALVAKTEVFGLKAPRHYFLISQLVVRSILFVILLLYLAGILSFSENLFLCTWLFYFFDGTVVATQIDITVIRFAPQHARKAISRRCILSNYFGLAFGLAVDSIILGMH